MASFRVLARRFGRAQFAAARAVSPPAISSVILDEIGTCAIAPTLWRACLVSCRVHAAETTPEVCFRQWFVEQEVAAMPREPASTLDRCQGDRHGSISPILRKAGSGSSQSELPGVS